MLYAATHTGLFRLPPDQQAERVSDGFHDLMGFTVTDQGQFLASGHPDLQTPTLRKPGAPPLLGLVTSPDQGRTWQPLSLLGETDFHALEVAHGRVYGADSTSGRFMFSLDERTWETRSTPGLTELALSPTDPDLLVGTTGNGAVRSRDGGRTWQPLQSPPIATLAWNQQALWASWPDGTLVASTDNGDTWQRRGTLGGQPEALLATSDNRLAAAVSGVGILTSQDEGRTWDVRYRTDRQ